jgi:hypothetical protein
MPNDSVSTSKMTAKQKDIVRLFESTGMLDATMKIIQQSMLAQAAQGKLGMVATNLVLDKLFKRLTDRQTFLEAILIPVYSEHYTHKEIKELLVIYETPVMQKAIKQMPDLNMAFVNKTRELALDIAKKQLSSLKEKFPFLKRAQEEGMIDG